MNDSDYTQDHGLTTEQIASAGSRQDQEDAPVLAGGEGYEDDNAGHDNGSVGYDNGSVGYDNGNVGYDNGNVGYDDNAGLVADQAASEGAGLSTPSGAGSVTAEPGTRAMLLEDGELQGITMRWKDIQAEFVDEPATAVKEADALVAELMQRLAAMFAAERAELETRWAGGNEVSTEDLRQGLRRYRSFFERLLAA